MKELKQFNKLIINEENRIALLKVDLEHLSRPSAIKKFLYLTPNLQPIKPSQIIHIEE